MTKRHKALVAAIACVLFWGLSFVSIKICVALIPPMTLGSLRFALATIFLFFIKRKYAPEEKIRKEDILLLVGAGVTGVTLYFFFENNAVSMIPASEAAIFAGSIPVFTMIAEGMKGKIISRHVKAGSPSKSKTEGKSLLYRLILPGAGALISLSGVTLVAGVSFALSGTAVGYAFMTGACVSWVSYCFFTEPLFKRRSRIYIVFWQSVIGFMGFLPFTLFETFYGIKASWQMPALHVWGHVIFLGIFCSAMGYWLYTLALRDLGVGPASLFINFIPVISAIGGFFVLGERLRPLQWLGAALVLVGVYLAMANPGKSGQRE